MDITTKPQVNKRYYWRSLLLLIRIIFHPSKINFEPKIDSLTQNLLSKSWKKAIRFVVKESAMTAKAFIDTLKIIAQEYTGSVAKREIFALAKEFLLMPVPEVVKLLRQEDEDYRLAAVAILDWKARSKKVSIQEKELCFQAYIQNHEYINNWGMVDRAAPYVVGGYLFDKDRSPLYTLAASSEAMERRTAIVSTYFFIRQNQVDDTFALAQILVNDVDEYVQKAVGSWVREAGKRDEERLKKFLDKNAASMPRITLRYAIEKLCKEERVNYLALK